jgi:hypothetical protein
MDGWMDGRMDGAGGRDAPRRAGCQVEGRGATINRWGARGAPSSAAERARKHGRASSASPEGQWSRKLFGGLVGWLVGGLVGLLSVDFTPNPPGGKNRPCPFL